ncbi:MAG: hypothetical protein ACKVT0_18675 [Planctomycetaceae bacterium]
MQFNSIIATIGGVLFFAGFAIEMIAVASMAIYPLRKALPFQSPFQLQSIGCICMLLGLVIGGLGALL